MRTTPLFLTDSYCREIQTEIMEVFPETDALWRVILDRTVFYPRGGGQSSDKGTLEGEAGWQGVVTQVLMKDGEIAHFVESDSAPEVGSVVTGAIDWERRYRNMQLHSAGHLVDFALYRMGYSPVPLRPMKADHGKKPSIYYQGTMSEEIRESLEQEANRIVQQDLELTTRLADLATLEKEAIYVQPGLPTDKPLRLLTLEGVGTVADGGTQVRRSSETGEILIPRITEKDGVTRIHYRLGVKA